MNKSILVFAALFAAPIFANNAIANNMHDPGFGNGVSVKYLDSHQHMAKTVIKHNAHLMFRRVLQNLEYALHVSSLKGGYMHESMHPIDAHRMNVLVKSALDDIMNLVGQMVYAVEGKNAESIMSYFESAVYSLNPDNVKAWTGKLIKLMYAHGVDLSSDFASKSYSPKAGHTVPMSHLTAAK